MGFVIHGVHVPGYLKADGYNHQWLSSKSPVDILALVQSSQEGEGRGVPFAMPGDLLRGLLSDYRIAEVATFRAVFEEDGASFAASWRRRSLLAEALKEHGIDPAIIHVDDEGYFRRAAEIVRPLVGGAEERAYRSIFHQDVFRRALLPWSAGGMGLFPPDESNARDTLNRGPSTLREAARACMSHDTTHWGSCLETSLKVEFFMAAVAAAVFGRDVSWEWIELRGDATSEGQRRTWVEEGVWREGDAVSHAFIQAHFCEGAPMPLDPFGLAYRHPEGEAVSWKPLPAYVGGIVGYYIGHYLGYQKRGQVDRALDAIFLVHLFQDTPQVSFSIGRLYDQKGLGDTALSWYEEALRQAPENIDYLDHVASLLLKKERWQDLIRIGQRFARLEPGNFKPHLIVGLAHEQCGHWAEAEVAYTLAITLKPDLPGLAETIRNMRQSGGVEGAFRAVTLTRLSNNLREDSV